MESIIQWLDSSGSLFEQEQIDGKLNGKQIETRNNKQYQYKSIWKMSNANFGEIQ